VGEGRAVVTFAFPKHELVGITTERAPQPLKKTLDLLAPRCDVLCSKRWATRGNRMTSSAANQLGASSSTQLFTQLGFFDPQSSAEGLRAVGTLLAERFRDLVEGRV
jgi:hypothetical protein